MSYMYLNTLRIPEGKVSQIGMNPCNSVFFGGHALWLCKMHKNKDNDNSPSCVAFMHITNYYIRHSNL